MKYNIPLPRVLDRQGVELRRLNVIDASVSLSLEPLSTAQIVLPIFENLNMREWVQMFTSQGDAGIFRVRSPGQNYRMESKQYTLDHGIVELSDYVIKGEVELNAAANSVITSIFSHYSGSMWRLGTIAPTKTVQYSGKYEDVLTALMSVMAQLPEYMMSFDQTQKPWVLNIVNRPQVIAGEGRLGRNIVSARILEDDTELCTRLLSPDLPNGKLDADTISLYGIVERFVGKDEDQAQEQFVSDCNEYLEQHKNPLLSITIDLCDLEQVTGEPLDGIELGSLYRLALPDYNTTYDQAVIHMQYTSVYGNPGRVMVTLANEEKTMSSVFHNASASSASARKKQSKINDQFGGAIKGNKEQLTIQSQKIDVLTNDLTITAGELQNVKLEVNEQGIRLSAQETAIENMNQRINAAEVTVTAQGVRIAATETDIDLLAETQEQQEATITTMAGEIQLKASQSSVDSLGNRVTNAESSITQNAEAIELRVEKNGVISAINQSSESVTISANKINLNGYVTATQFEAEQARLTNIVSGNTSVSKIVGVTANFSDLIVTNSLTFGPQSVNVIGAVASLGPASASDGQITIPWTKLDGTAGTAVTFNIADTQFYKDAVASAKNAMGVQIDQANQSVVVAESATKSALIASTVSLIYNTSNHKYTATTAATANGTTMHTNSAVSGTEAYEAGEDDGYTAGYSDGVNDGYATGAASVTVDSVVKYQADDYDTTTHNYTVYVRGTASNGETLDNSLSVNGAPAYNAGWSAGYAAAPVNPTISQCYIPDNALNNVSVTAKSGGRYNVTGSVTIRVNFSDGTHTTYGPYTVSHYD